MSYHRVIPRDLFNEAKLLKCLGRLALLEVNKQSYGIELNHAPTIDRPDFHIQQDLSNGDLICTNIEITYLDLRSDGIPRRVGIDMFSPINHRDPWPLKFEDKYGDMCPVFNESGDLSAEILKHIGVEVDA